jgi:hypothetical protein
VTTADISRAGRLQGREITLAARDYFGGTRPLTLLVTRIAAGRGDPDWIVLTGVRIDTDGVAHEKHTVAARLSALLAFLPGDADDAG